MYHSVHEVMIQNCLINGNSAVFRPRDTSDREQGVGVDPQPVRGSKLIADRAPEVGQGCRQNTAVVYGFAAQHCVS